MAYNQGHTVPNPYNIPPHKQGKENNCTSHAFALCLEFQLSELFKERTLVDVDDLWKKQKKFGTATDDGDLHDGPFIVAEKYGVKFKTDSGIKGICFLNGKIITKGSVKYYLHNIKNNIRYIFTK